MQKKALNSLFLAMLIIVTAIGALLICGSDCLVSAVHAGKSSNSSPPGGTWTPTGELNTARAQFTATLLANGKVLVAGGHNFQFLKSAEIYDAASGMWTATGDLNTARTIHTATLLGSGKVLAVGGLMYAGGTVYLKSAEIFDPVSGTWTASGSLTTGRSGHTATLLANGKVLVAGGENVNILPPAVKSAEIYDPAPGTWTVTGSLNAVHFEHTATLLPNGKVLVAGGNLDGDGRSTEIYDPASGTWAVSGSLTTGRREHTATLLANGKVLVTGGVSVASPSSLSSAEIYDPASGTWTATGDLNTARQQHTATLLTNGKVLVAGGMSSGIGVVHSAEIYDPALGTWTGTGDLSTDRENHTATLLANGKVLVAGGDDGSSWWNSTELYMPVLPPHTITATAGPNGAISPSGQVAVNDGDSQTFTITPNPGYHVSDALVDGSHIGAVRKYTFNNVTADHNLSASFAKNGPLPLLQLLMNN